MDIKVNCDICGKEMEIEVEDIKELEEEYFAMCNKCLKEEGFLSEGKDN